MESFDIVIVGAGAAGEAAAGLASGRGASVAVIDRELFGGACPFWACMPSKALLHAAAVRHAGGDYEWPRASSFRDWMINREGIDFPNDHSHVESLEKAGATTIRGQARLAGPGRVQVSTDGASRELLARAVILAVGSHARIPPIEGLGQIDYWTSRQGTATRELPRSLVILGGGPTGVELAQVYARYGVRTVLVDSNPRVLTRDHPRNSEYVARGLRRDGVDVRTAVRGQRVRPHAGRDGAHAIDLSDGSTIEGHELLVAVGRELPVAELGLETVGVEIDDGRLHPDDHLRIAENLFVIGDVAGPELHTHLAHYQGEIAARQALGEDVKPDHTAIPRATYTDPEAAGVGLRLDEAQERGHDAFEETADVATSAKGYVVEAEGHVTIVVDRRERVLLGAFIAGPGAAEAIHEAVLAVKVRVPLAVLADTIHAFPTLTRVMGGLFGSASRKLEGDGHG